jgi:hypothetical protein
MLTKQEFQAFQAQFCDGTSWTATFLQPGALTRWKCNACGKEIEDNLTVSAGVIFGTHYKPGYGPTAVGGAAKADDPFALDPKLLGK